MAKFKVGDRVRVIDPDPKARCTTGVVSAVYDDGEVWVDYDDGHDGDIYDIDLEKIEETEIGK